MSRYNQCHVCEKLCMCSYSVVLLSYASCHLHLSYSLSNLCIPSAWVLKGEMWSRFSPILQSEADLVSKLLRGIWAQNVCTSKSMRFGDGLLCSIIAAFLKTIWSQSSNKQNLKSSPKFAEWFKGVWHLE